MMAAESGKKDGLCSLTAQKLTEDRGIPEAAGRNHPGYSAEDFCESERIEPHRVKNPYPDDDNLKRLAKDIKVTHKSGAQLKNNEYGKVWTSIQNKKTPDDNSSIMDQDLASKLKERSKKMQEESDMNDLPPPPAFSQVQLRKTGSRELLNIE